jgi:O-antigen/teichoic acid export membrane protein
VLTRFTTFARQLAVYGAGDVAVQFIGFLLLPVYTRYLSPSDYGIIALLLTIEAPAKILFRWGVDTAFMRLYYDCPGAEARQRLASTVFFFMLAANGVLALGTIAAATWVSGALLGTAEHGLLVALVVGNTFLLSFHFLPLYVLRMTDRSGQFIALTIGQSGTILVLRLVLVIGFELGIFGVVLADVLVTAGFTMVLTRWWTDLIRPVFSKAILSEALRFGLPRIPHSLGSQVIGLADRYFLSHYGHLADVGLYSIGATFGLALKLFVGAFGAAWTPFFLGLMREPDARRTYGLVSTYALAALVLLGAGLCATASDLVSLGTAPVFHEAAAVTPWIALGVMFQGIYIIGSIGLIITKRTGRYPVSTGLAALVSLVANALLIPRFGMLGAAWANALAYATLAAVTTGLSWQVYPIPYEWSRLGRVVLAGVLAFVGADRLVPAELTAWVSLLVRGTAVVAIYLAFLAGTGFFDPRELAVLRELRRRFRAPRRRPSGDLDTQQTEMAGEMVGSVRVPEMDVVDEGVPRRKDSP